MHIITKTVTKVVLETTRKEILEVGFDDLWEDVVKQFPKDKYSVFSIGAKPNQKELIYIELIPISISD